MIVEIIKIASAFAAALFKVALILAGVIALVVIAAIFSPGNNTSRRKVRTVIRSEDDAEVIGDVPRVTTPAKFPKSARVRDMEEPMGM